MKHTQNHTDTKICTHLRNLRFLTLAAVTAGICFWLRADTKPEEPEPGETQMMMVDGAFTTLYPELPRVGLMAKDLRLSIEDLDAAEEDVEGLYLLWESLDTRLDTIEGELEATP